MTELLIVLSAFLHAAWNAMVKRSGRPRGVGLAVVATSTLVAALLMAFEALVRHVPPFPSHAGVAWAVFSGILEAGYLATLFAGLADAHLSVVYTVSRGAALLIVWPVSVLLFSEPLTTLDAVAVLGLLAGLLACGLEGTQVVRGAGWGAACAVFVAGYNLTYKLALATGAMPAAVFTVSTSVAIAANWVLIGPPARAELLASFRTQPRWILAGGIVCAASFLVFLFALRDAGVGLAFTLRNTSVVFAALLGWAMGEPRSPRQAVGVALVAASAVVLGT